MTSAETIAHALGGHRCGDGYLIRCPVPSHGKGRGDKNPSCSIQDGHTTLLVKCFTGCEARDVLDMLQHRGLLDHDARDHHGDRRHRPDCRRQLEQREPNPDPRGIEIWRNSHPLEGTLGGRYLREHRSLLGPFPPSLRFIRSAEHPRTGLLLPALVAALSRPDGEVVAVQLTFLRPVDGRKNPSSTPRINVGKFGTGAVRIDCGRDHPGLQLGLAEGIETALSAQQLSGVPTWATLGGQRLRSITLPRDIREIHIFADNDEPGRVAAEHAAARYTRDGLTVRLRWPPEEFGDWNNYLMARRA